MPLEPLEDGRTGARGRVCFHADHPNELPGQFLAGLKRYQDNMTFFTLNPAVLQLLADALPHEAEPQSRRQGMLSSTALDSLSPAATPEFTVHRACRRSCNR